MGLDEGPFVGTDDGPLLREGPADEMDKGLANGAGMDEVSADGILRQAPRSYIHRKMWLGPSCVLSMSFQ